MLLSTIVSLELALALYLVSPQIWASVHFQDGAEVPVCKGLLHGRLHSLKWRTKPHQWLGCSWVGIQVCKLLPGAPWRMWGGFLLYMVGGKYPKIGVKCTSFLQGRARGKGKGWDLQKAALSLVLSKNRSTRTGACFKYFLPRMKCLFPFRITKISNIH